MVRDFSQAEEDDLLNEVKHNFNFKFKTTNIKLNHFSKLLIFNNPKEPKTTRTYRLRKKLDAMRKGSNKIKLTWPTRNVLRNKLALTKCLTFARTLISGTPVNTQLERSILLTLKR